MNLSSLKPAKGSVRSGFRRGRGQGSGGGGTACRGHKGNKSRSGYRYKRGFEGGQMPLQRRIPKFGFKSLHPRKYVCINISTINQLAAGHNLNSFNPEVFTLHGLASKNAKIKVLGKGKIERACQVEAHAFSKNAVSQIESAGGKATVIK